MTTGHGDIISMRIHLNELKNTFDKAMRDGQIFEYTKKIYLQIKQLEVQLEKEKRERKKV